MARMLQEGEKMYHVKCDKRSKTSANLICDGLAKMIKKKRYEEISISDVCDECGVARTTFYRLFDILDDVLLYQFDLLFEKSLSEYKAKNNETYAKAILEIAMKNKSLVSLLVESGRTDLFDFTARNKEDILIKSMNIDINPLNKEYCSVMLNSMVLAIIRKWLMMGSRQSIDELYCILKENIELIKRYL